MFHVPEPFPAFNGAQLCSLLRFVYLVFLGQQHFEDCRASRHTGSCTCFSAALTETLEVDPIVSPLCSWSNALERTD